MKRVFGFVAAAVMVMMASVAFGNVQEFSKFTIDIPDGWTAKEDGPALGVIKDDQTASLTIAVDQLKPGDTFGDLAAAMSQYMGGTTPEADADGDYTFTAQNGQVVVLVTGDNNAGVYAAFTMFGLETQAEAIGEMVKSVKFK
ncbi:MAG: hypothetical protein K5841_06655 [Fretibacterium sp.]|nr:hypothetical protein [Fretibacterium sp.]